MSVPARRFYLLAHLSAKEDRHHGDRRIPRPRTRYPRAVRSPAEDERHKVEAVRGRLVREPRPAPLHSSVQASLVFLLEAHERARRTGGVVLVETEFVLSLDPLTVRVPDVAWVSAGRIPPNGYTLPRWHFAPDLAAEVVSPR